MFISSDHVKGAFLLAEETRDQLERQPVNRLFGPWPRVPAGTVGEAGATGE
ncbi:hypothetical protein KI387_041961, partial [Taxus chinensis]